MSCIYGILAVAVTVNFHEWLRSGGAYVCNYYFGRLKTEKRSQWSWGQNGIECNMYFFACVCVDAVLHLYVCTYVDLCHMYIFPGKQSRLGGRNPESNPEIAE